MNNLPFTYAAEYLRMKYNYALKKGLNYVLNSICRLSVHFEHIWSLTNLLLTFVDNKSNLAFQKDTLEKRSFFFDEQHALKRDENKR